MTSVYKDKLVDCIGTWYIIVGLVVKVMYYIKCNLTTCKRVFLVYKRKLLVISFSTSSCMQKQKREHKTQNLNLPYHYQSFKITCNPSDS